MMNQDRVKEMLLRLDPDAGDFTVVFSGKASGKVDGLYYPDRKEIIIHNRNFEEEGPLIYTAIHEFAHHIQHERSPVPLSTRAHTTRFWDILHRLLNRAEEMGIYENIFRKDRRFTELTRRIREEFLAANGSLMKELGGMLQRASELCREVNASFDDYVDRELLLHRSAAKLVMKIREKDIAPSIGYENMKTVASIRDDGARARAEEAFAKGSTPDMVKAAFTARGGGDGALDTLMRERDRIERSIEALSKKLAKVDRRIHELKHEEKKRRTQ